MTSRDIQIPEQFWEYSDKATSWYKGRRLKHGHTYLEVYELLLRGRDVRSVLEIGVRYGGSLLLWEAFFPDASITGVDVDMSRIHVDMPDGVRLLEMDVKDLDTDEQWDLIVDDGSHKVSDQLWVLNNLTGNVAPQGMIIIEDVQSDKGLERLFEEFSGDKGRLLVIDRRLASDKYDDLMLVYWNGDMRSEYD